MLAARRVLGHCPGSYRAQCASIGTRQRRAAHVARSTVVDAGPATATVEASAAEYGASAEQFAAAAARATDGASARVSGAKVADLDAARFRLHPSVHFWQDFTSPINTMWSNSDSSFAAAGQQLLQQALLGAGALSDAQSAAYWSYHTARLSFFVTQAAAGVVAHHLSETLPSSLPASLASLARGFAGGGSRGADGGTAAANPSSKTPFQRLSANMSQELSSRVNEAIATFQQDFDNIRNGYYPMPWDMEPTHRQNNPLFMLRRTAQFLDESVATLRRRVREQPEPVWLSSQLYPRYYTNSFHFQTDGWFSDRSANVYEHSTEVLFFGRQDAMQRTSLLPIADFVREAEGEGRPVRELRLLEVAAGTGRFHTFIKDAHPDLPSVVSDLSPFYLARARDNLRYWRSRRQPDRPLGGVDGTGADFLQTAAEAIAAPDESYDIVVCVYLFHELPEPVRRAAAAEFLRVLRPGGLMVLTDSVQMGDRPAWDKSIGVFGDFNEPYYRSYISCDLGAMFESVGFECDTKYLCSASKTLSFRKPKAPAAEVAAAQ